MAKNGSKALTDPTRLQPIDKNDGTLLVIVETPSGSRNKFAFDPEQGIFCLRKVLPAGMVFPYDFGFLPGTKAQDGDPIDVLLLMDEPAYPGCAVKARLIGVMEGEQIEGKRKVRNDRLLAVAHATHMYANVESLDDLPKRWLQEVEQFFVNYHHQEGMEYKLLGYKDATEAMRLIKEAQEAA